MANIAILILVLLVAWYVTKIVRRHSHGLVPKRGVGMAADLGSLSDKPRVRVVAVTKAGPDRVRLILRPESDPSDVGGSTSAPDLDFIVFLTEDAFGMDLLDRWKRSGSSLAIVTPPDSRIVRLRSIDDLQPLTLRCVGEG